MSIPRYEKYKDSGVEWLGDVPEHWAVKRIRYLARVVTDAAQSTENVVALENIESWTGRFVSTGTKFEGDGVAFREGDLLFGKLRPYLAKILVAESAGAAVGDFHVLRPSVEVQSNFLKYLFLTPSFIHILDGSTIGAKMPRVGWPFLANEFLPIPSPLEQKNLATFLGSETAKIDALIEEQRRLIALLKEKRQAVISHAVTKGLDPTVLLKDSGFAYIGQIPQGWGVRKVTDLFSLIGSGTTPKSDNSDYFDGGTIPWVNTGDLNDSLLTTKNRYVSDLAREHYSSLRLFPRGSVVIAMYGATIGKLSVLDYEATVNQACCVFAGAHGIDANFCFYFFWGIRTALVNMASGGGQPNISQEVLRSLRLPVPTRAEQESIVTFLHRQNEQSEAALCESERITYLLQERRSALISAAVTGKIDVRNYIPRTASSPQETHGSA